MEWVYTRIQSIYKVYKLYIVELVTGKNTLKHYIIFLDIDLRLNQRPTLNNIVNVI